MHWGIRIRKMKYVTIKNEKLHAFYDDKMNNNIPGDAIEITDEQFISISENPDNYIYMKNSDGLIITPKNNNIDLNDYKNTFKSLILELANLAHSDIPYSQQVVYKLKFDEASNFINDKKNGTTRTYHILDRESLTTGLDKETIALSIIKKHNEWLNKTAMIEDTRISLNKLILSATSKEEVT